MIANKIRATIKRINKKGNNIKDLNINRGGKSHRGVCRQRIHRNTQKGFLGWVPLLFDTLAKWVVLYLTGSEKHGITQAEPFSYNYKVLTI